MKDESQDLTFEEFQISMAQHSCPSCTREGMGKCRACYEEFVASGAEPK